MAADVRFVERIEQERRDQGLPARLAEPTALRAIAALVTQKGGTS
jgi:hypothetical protein